MMGDGGMMSWGMGLWMFLGMVLWVLLLVALILLVVWVVRQFSGVVVQPPPPREDSALEILRKRYARGEISKEEFEEKKRDLEA